MRVAVFFNQGEMGGGGFNYELSVANILKQHSSSEYEFIFFSSSLKSIERFSKMGIEVSYFKKTWFSKIHSGLLSNLFIYNQLRKIKCHLSQLDRLLLKHKADLVYFVSPNAYSGELTIHNFITTVWDLCHRDHMEFPEVYQFRQFENREMHYFKKHLARAVAVFADSQLGKKNIVSRYGVDERRIVVQPFLFSCNDNNTKSLDIKKKYSIPGDYIFYPAQFWAHKNHAYILRAMKILKEVHGICLYAVFSGADQGNKSHIENLVCKYGLQDQVKFIGFVDANEIPSLYRQALALVMPTYFGPTNIPPLEAFAFECPVCYSDLDGLRDQVGAAAFLLNLSDPVSLVENILRIQSEPLLVQKKIALGKQIISFQNEKQFWHNLKPVLEEFLTKRQCYFNLH